MTNSPLNTADSEDAQDVRLLITGATGFIGSRLALHARRLGLDVLATGRAAGDLERERLGELQAANVATAVGDLQAAAFVREIVAGRTHVIHLAAAQHEAEMPDAFFKAINVDAVRTLLDACRTSGVRRFVYGGTIGVYGGDGCLGALAENTPPSPQNIYAATKLEAETLVRSYAGQPAFCIVRIAETYGPGDRRLLKLFDGVDRGRFFMIGRGENERQCIHVDDLTRGLLLAARHPRASGETFVLAGGRAMTTNDMVRHIAHALDRPAPRAQAPLWPFLIAAKAMEAVLPPLHIKPPLHTRRLDFFRKSFTFSTTKARDVLGFQPEIDFPAGAEDTVRWYRDHGLLSSRTGGELARSGSV